MRGGNQGGKNTCRIRNAFTDGRGAIPDNGRGATTGFVELCRDSAIRATRVDRNLSQAGFARELGISEAYLSRIENEKRMASRALLEPVSDWTHRNDEDDSGRETISEAFTSLEPMKEQGRAVGLTG